MAHRGKSCRKRISRAGRPAAHTLAASAPGNADPPCPRHGRTAGRSPPSDAACAAGATPSAPPAPPAPPSRCRTSRAAIPRFEVLGEDGLRRSSTTRTRSWPRSGIEFRDDPEALALWKAAGADVQGERVRFPRGMCRELIRNARAARVRAVRAQSGAQRAHRRRLHGVRAGVRLAVHPQPRRRPPLRAARGLPQLRQARLHGELAAPLGRHDLRAGRPAGQQAPPRHGVQPRQVQRQAVHGLGHGARARSRQRRTGEDRVRRRGRRSRDAASRARCWSA